MIASQRTASISLLLFLLILSGWCATAVGDSMAELGLPPFPKSKLVTEINLPQSTWLDSIAKEFGPWLGISAISQLSLVVYSIDSPEEAEKIFEFYEPSISAQAWRRMVRNFSGGGGQEILLNERMGIFIMQVDPPGRKLRELAFLHIAGEVDPSKLGDPQRKLPEMISKIVKVPSNDNVQNASRILIGQPIAVPPSETLHLKATQSDIRAMIFDRTTAEIQLAVRTDDPGELVRTDDRLLLSLTPKVSVDDIMLPGAVPVILEVTGGSLTVQGGPRASDRPVGLSIISTSAPITLQNLALVSGMHSVRSTAGEVNVAFSVVEGGKMVIEVTGADASIIVPKTASAQIQAVAASGKVENLTGLEPQNSTDSSVALQLGGGKAEISLRTINGSVRIKYAD